MTKRIITSSHAHTALRRGPLARLASGLGLGLGLVGAACQHDDNASDPDGPTTCADPRPRAPGGAGDAGSDPTVPRFPADLGGIGAIPGHAPFDPTDFDVRSERAVDGGVAHLAELSFETATGIAGRLELTTLPGRGQRWRWSSKAASRWGSSTAKPPCPLRSPTSTLGSSFVTRTATTRSSWVMSKP